VRLRGILPADMLRTVPISIESFEAVVGQALRREPVQNQLPWVRCRAHVERVMQISF